MGTAITDWGRTQWSSMLVGLVSVPTDYYLALTAAEPGTGVDGSLLAALEPSGGGYSRQQVPSGSSHWGVTASGLVANLASVDFGVPSASWGYISHGVICDAASGGHVYAYGEFTKPMVFDVNYLVRIPPGAFILQARSVNPSIVT